MNKRAYKDVKYLFIVINEWGKKEEFIEGKTVFCSCEYVNEKSKIYDKMEKYCLSDDIISLNAKITLLDNVQV